MKSTVAPYVTRALCLRIECADGTTIRLTRYPVDLTMSNGQIYLTGSGFDFTSLQSTTTFSASAVDLDGIIGMAGISRDKLASGVFDNARCYLFACDFLAPVEDYEPVTASFLGKVQMIDGRYIAEEVALIDALNQSVGEVYTAGCQKEFGGTEFGGCQVPLAAHTVIGAVTSVTSPLVFVDGSRGEASDHFTAGKISFTSGPNAGLAPISVQSYAAGGTFTLGEPPYYPLEAGVVYSLVRGCRKTLDDCRAFSNVLRFGGFPNVPTSEIYTQRGGS